VFLCDFHAGVLAGLIVRDDTQEDGVQASGTP